MASLKSPDVDTLGKLPSVFARNCTARRIDKGTAAVFLSSAHKFGDASARYRYGLFVERNTGKEETAFQKGTLVAVATFSSARKMRDRSRSFEWVRYASLPGTRVIGGMGKLLDAFVEEVRPDDVMTYAPAQCGDGDVYIELGFSSEGSVSFRDGEESVKFRKKF